MVMRDAFRVSYPINYKLLWWLNVERWEKTESVRNFSSFLF